MAELVNPFEMPGRWYKANLHAHSTTSDGALSPRERVEQYREAGYSVLALSDHRKTQDITGLGDETFLVVGSMEYHPVCADPAGWYHLVALGIPRAFELEDPPADANDAIARVEAAGGLSFLAHPAWCGQGFGAWQHMRGIAALEVWNSTCDRAGRPSSESDWAIALDHGWRLPCVGTDDCHLAYDGDVLEGWTWLRMPSLGTAEVLTAVRSGACYASCGPTIHDFRIRDGKVYLRCSPAAKIHFVGGSGQGERLRADKGRVVVEFEIDVPRWPYVRAVVTSGRGDKAWTNPIFL